MNKPMDGMRSISHLYILSIHYITYFRPFNDKSHIFPIPFLHLSRVILMFIFVIFFVNSGINSGRWITNKIRKNSNIGNYFQILLRKTGYDSSLNLYLLYNLYHFHIIHKE